MPNFRNPPATAFACLRASLRADVAVARVRLAAGLQVLILVLLARLIARAETAWHDSPDNIDDDTSYALVTPTMGRAPHAAVVEAGLVPDWVLSGMRNRGLRPAAVPSRPRRRARPARAPPAPRQASRENTPQPGDADARLYSLYNQNQNRRPELNRPLPGSPHPTGTRRCRASKCATPRPP